MHPAIRICPGDTHSTTAVHGMEILFKHCIPLLSLACSDSMARVYTYFPSMSIGFYKYFPILLLAKYKIVLTQTGDRLIPVTLLTMPTGIVKLSSGLTSILEIREL